MTDTYLVGKCPYCNKPTIWTLEDFIEASTNNQAQVYWDMLTHKTLEEVKEIAKNMKTCQNCKSLKTDNDDEPCISCVLHKNWEAEP